MPQREFYEQQGGDASTGAHSLLSVLSQSKNLTSGFAGFAIKTMVVSSSAATVFGMTSYMLLHGPLGPALSFLIGSGAGFIGGLVTRWRTDTAEACVIAAKFPRLLEYHIRVGEAGRQLEGQSFAEWAKDLHRNPRKQGICISAMYSAAPALDRIRQEEEDALVAAYASASSAGQEEEE